MASPVEKSLEDVSMSRSKSCETACSSNSSCFFKKRKPTNPLASSLRSCMSRSTASTGNNGGVRQRVLSAKLLKLRSVQNQLNDANFHLAEAMRENQALKTLQKRQDKALSKYEGTKADLPRLLHIHEEEIRILTEKNKNLRKTVKELTDSLKSRSEEVGGLQEQLKHFEKLDKSKHLLEREKLIEQVDDLKAKLQKADEEVVVLNRKLTLEVKSAKQKIIFESSKHKQCQKDLAQAMTEIGRLTKLLEGKERLLAANNVRSKRFVSLPQRQSHSLISLSCGKSQISGASSDLNLLNGFEKSPVTDVKLEPIQNTKEEMGVPNGILKHPSENIMARLSSASLNRHFGSEPDDIDEEPEEAPAPPPLMNGRTKNNQKLDRLAKTLQNSVKRSEENGGDIDRRLGDCCLQAMDSVKNCNDAIDAQMEKLEHAKSDTEKLYESFREVENLDLKLRRSHLNDYDPSDEGGGGLDMASQILKDELVFQKQYNTGSTNKDRNGNVSGEKKSKLLAALRAIDNGDSLDSFEGGQQDEEDEKLMKELFGRVTD